MRYFLAILAFTLPLHLHASDDEDSLWLALPETKISLLGTANRISDFGKEAGTACHVSEALQTPKEHPVKPHVKAIWYESDGFCVTRGKDLDKKYAALKDYLLTPSKYVGKNPIEQLIQYKRIDNESQDNTGLVDHKIFLVLRGFGIGATPILNVDYYYTLTNRPIEERTEGGWRFAMPWDTKVEQMEAEQEGRHPLTRVQGLWYAELDEKAEKPFLYFRYYNAADLNFDVGIFMGLLRRHAKSVHRATLKTLEGEVE